MRRDGERGIEYVVHDDVDDVYWSNDNTLKKAFKIAIDDIDTNKLRMLIWAVNEVTWSDAVAIAVGVAEQKQEKVR